MLALMPCLPSLLCSCPPPHRALLLVQASLGPLRAVVSKPVKVGHLWDALTKLLPATRGALPSAVPRTAASVEVATPSEQPTVASAAMRSALRILLTEVRARRLLSCHHEPHGAFVCSCRAGSYFREAHSQSSIIRCWPQADSPIGASACNAAPEGTACRFDTSFIEWPGLALV